MANSMLRVSDERISEVLTYDILIDGIEDALKKFSSRPESGVVQPVRPIVTIKKHNGFVAAMPGYSEQDNALVTKILSFFPNNKDVPSHNAVLIAMDADTGQPIAILDGDVITRRRTAAASAVATKYLVNGQPDILAILGAGEQARAHFQALTYLYRFKEVRIWNHRFESAERLSQELGAVACKSAEDAVKDADVIVTVTSSATPVLQKSWVKQGAHINAVGACRSDWQEIDPALMTSVTLYTDDVESALQQSGDIIMSKAQIYGEIGEVILGKKEARRNETTIFKSLGIAIEDVISAKLVMDKLKQEKV